MSEHDAAVEAIRARSPEPPQVGVVLGSGLGGFADAVEDAVEVPYGDIPGWPVSTVSRSSLRGPVEMTSFPVSS